MDNKTILSYLIIHYFHRAVKGYFVNEWKNAKKSLANLLRQKMRTVLCVSHRPSAGIGL